MLRLLTIVLTLAGTHAQGLIIDPYRFTVPNTNTLNDDLLWYYKLDETTGSRVDSGPSGLNLTDNSSVAFNTGIIANAAAYTGVSADFLSYTDNAAFEFGTNSFTIAVWVYPSISGSAMAVMGKAGLSGTDISWAIRHTGGDNRIMLTISLNGSTEVTVQTGNTLTEDAWNFVVAWRDRSDDRIRISLNNGAAGSAAVAATTMFNSAADFKIGGSFGISGGNPWEGRIDEAGGWLRVLTADERTYLYDAGAGRTCCPYP